MSEVFDLKARLEADASPFERAMDASASSTSSALQSIAAAANIYIGKTVVSAFSKAMDKAFEFGQVMADISSISDVSISKLSANIRQLDNVYGSMSSVGNSIYNIISSGFDRSESELMEMVTTVGQASKSIRAELYATANVFTTVANAYHLSSNQFKDIADMLFVTVKEGKAEGNELARTLGLVVNTASEAGLSLAEVSAVIATLSRTQTTSQAMIGFNQMLNAIIKPSQEAREEAERWGIELGASALKTKGFTAIIKEMHDKLQGNAEAINKISGPIRAMRAVISLTGKQYDEFINILEEAESKIGAGVAMDAFVKQTATAEQALKNLRVQYEKTLIDVVQGAEPVLVPILKGIESALKAFSGGNHIVRDVVKAVGDTKGEVDGITQGIDLFVSGLSRINIYFVIITSAIRTVSQTIKQLSTIANSLTATADAIKSNVSTTNSLLSDSAKNTDRLVSSLNNATNAAMRFNKALGSANDTIRNIGLHEARIARVVGLTPEQQRAAVHKAYYMTPEQVKAQATANFEATHINVGGNRWQDHTHLSVSRDKWIAEEQERIVKELRRARKRLLTEEQARHDAVLKLQQETIQSLTKQSQATVNAIDKSLKISVPLHKQFGYTMIYGIKDVGSALSKGANALYTGFMRLSQVLMAWDIGTFIGNTIREAFGTDDMFVRSEDRRVLEAEVPAAIAAGRRTGHRQLKYYGEAKVLSADFIRKTSIALEKANTQAEINRVLATITNEVNKHSTTVESNPTNQAIQQAINALSTPDTDANRANMTQLNAMIDRIVTHNSDLDMSELRKWYEKVVAMDNKAYQDAHSAGSLMSELSNMRFPYKKKKILGGPLVGLTGKLFGIDTSSMEQKVGLNMPNLAELSGTLFQRTYADSGNNAMRAKYDAQIEALKPFLSYTDKFEPFTIDINNVAKSYSEYIKRITTVSTRLTDINKAIEQTERDTEAHTVLTNLKVNYENLVKEMEGSVSSSYNESTIRDIIKQVQDTLFTKGLIPGTQKYVDEYTKTLQLIRDEMPKEGGEQFEAFRTQVAHQITEEVTKAKTNLSDNVLKSLKDHVDNTLKDTEDSVILETKTEEESLNIQIKTLEDAINNISNLKDVDTDDAKRLIHDYTVSIAKFKKRLTEVHNNIADTALNTFTNSIEANLQLIEDNAIIEGEDKLQTIQKQLNTLATAMKNTEGLKNDGVAAVDIAKVQRQLNVKKTKLEQQYTEALSDMVDKYMSDYTELVSDLNEQVDLRLIMPDVKFTELQAYLDNMEKEIQANDKLTAELREKLKNVISRYRRSTELSSKEYDYSNIERNTSVMRAKAEAGMVTSNDVLKYELQIAQDMYKKASLVFSTAVQGTADYTYAERELEDATISLASAFKKLEDSAIEQRNATMSQVQTYFKGGMLDNGSLTNNALYHSVNLMKLSRVEGISTVDTPNVQNARQAQTAVARSIDAWVTEQRYSQANIGKTVADIYDYMQGSNIVIGG